MKGYAMLKIGVTGWIEKEAPACRIELNQTNTQEGLPWERLYA